MVARHETHPGSAAGAGPAEFRAAVESMRQAALRPEVFCEEMPAPQRIAPWSSALSGDVTVDDEDLGPLRMQNVMCRFSDTPGSIEFTGRRVGQDNEELYRTVLGIDKPRLAELVAEGIA